MNHPNFFKRFALLAMVFIFGSFLPLIAQQLQAGQFIGDVTDDQKVDIIDALQTASYASGLSTQQLYVPVADPSNDEQISIIDALLIAQYTAGLVKEFPRVDPVKIFQDWAATQKINLTGYMLNLIGNKASATILPGYAFVRLVLRQYPVVYGTPDPQIGEHCLAAVKGKTVELIHNETELTTFFAAHQLPVSTTPGEAYLKLVMKAWLTLSQELKNDGFYTFVIPDDTIVILPTDSFQVAGVSQVASGGSGAIKANAWFGNNFILVRVVENVSLVPGIRPVCQSTKLLDKDPIVRKMAEQDLLTMGVSCLDYLAAQRAKAAPELQKAMDRIKLQILKQEEQLRKIRAMLSH